MVPVLHRSASLLVRVAKRHYLSFVVRGKEVEFFGPERLRGVTILSTSDGERAYLELHGTFKGATAYGSDAALREIGPIPLADGEAAVADLNRRLGLPKPVHQVTIEQLERDPAAYAGRWIDVVVRWQRGFECSSCGVKTSIWLDAPSPVDPIGDDSWVRVVGRFEYAAPGSPTGGFGHMGMATSAIEACSVHPVQGAGPAAKTVPGAANTEAATLRLPLVEGHLELTGTELDVALVWITPQGEQMHLGRMPGRDLITTLLVLLRGELRTGARTILRRSAFPIARFHDTGTTLLYDATACGFELFAEPSGSPPCVVGFVSSEEVQCWREVLLCPFGAWRSSTLDGLLDNLCDPEWRSVVYVVGELAKHRFQQPRIVEALVEQLQHPEDEVRSAAARALCRQGRSASVAIPALLDLLLREPDVHQASQILQTQVEIPRGASQDNSGPGIDLRDRVRAVIPLPHEVHPAYAVVREGQLYLAGTRKLARRRSSAEIPPLEYGVHIVDVAAQQAQWRPLSAVFDWNSDTTDSDRRNWDIVAALPNGPVFALQYPVADEQHRLRDYAWLVLFDTVGGPYFGPGFSYLVPDDKGSFLTPPIGRTPPSMRDKALEGQIRVWQQEPLGSLEWGSAHRPEGHEDRRIAGLSHHQRNRLSGRWRVRDQPSPFDPGDERTLPGFESALAAMFPGKQAYPVAHEVAHDGTTAQLAILLRGTSSDDVVLALVEVAAPPAPETVPLAVAYRERSKAFTLCGRRVDIEDHPGGTGHRITVDGVPVAMFYTARETTTGNSGTGPAKVTVAIRPAEQLELDDLLDAKTAFEPTQGQRASCLWVRGAGAMYNTAIYTSHHVVLEFSEDWSSVTLTWTTDTDLST
jgi:hypothetical protein